MFAFLWVFQIKNKILMLIFLFLERLALWETLLTSQSHRIHSRQAVLALSVNMNCITPSALEKFSLKSRSGYQVVRAASIKAFISWVKFGWLYWSKIESKNLYQNMLIIGLLDVHLTFELFGTAEREKNMCLFHLCQPPPLSYTLLCLTCSHW